MLLSIIIPESFAEWRFDVHTVKFYLTFAKKNMFDFIEQAPVSPPKSFDRVTIFRSEIGRFSDFTSSISFAKIFLSPIFKLISS